MSIEQGSLGPTALALPPLRPFDTYERDGYTEKDYCDVGDYVAVAEVEARERILFARIAELEADAGRYRFLREKTSLAWSRMGVLAFAHYQKDASDKAALDAAIDAIAYASKERSRE